MHTTESSESTRVYVHLRARAILLISREVRNTICRAVNSKDKNRMLKINSKEYGMAAIILTFSSQKTL